MNLPRPEGAHGGEPVRKTSEMIPFDTVRNQLFFLIEEAESLRTVLPFIPESLVRERPRPDQCALVETFQLIAWLDTNVRVPALLGQMDTPAPPSSFPLDVPFETVFGTLVESRLLLLNTISPDSDQRRCAYLWSITQEDAEILRNTGSFLLDAQRLG